MLRFSSILAPSAKVLRQKEWQINTLPEAGLARIRLSRRIKQES